MSAQIKFKCSCGKSLKADVDAAGKKCKCTGCGQIVRIPQPPAGVVPSHDFNFVLTPLDDSADLDAPAPIPESPPPVSRPSSPPPLPPAARPMSAAGSPPAAKSIWDEEDEYRLQAPPDVPCTKCGSPMSSQAVVCMSCGYNRQSGAMPASTLAPAPAPKKPSPFAWAQRRKRQSSGETMSLRWIIIPLALGIGIFIFGIREKKLADASSAEPETISLEKLIRRGAEGNPNIILTDFQICDKFVYQTRSVAGIKQESYSAVWVPIVVGGRGLFAPLAGADLSSPRAIIYSSHVSNNNELIQKLGVPQLRGMVTNQIKSLNAKEKELLRQNYHAINFDQCLIIDEGREPTNSGLIALYLAGGGGLVLFGLGMGVKRFLG